MIGPLLSPTARSILDPSRRCDTAPIPDVLFWHPLEHAIHADAGALLAEYAAAYQTRDRASAYVEEGNGSVHRSTCDRQHLGGDACHPYAPPISVGTGRVADAVGRAAAAPQAAPDVVVARSRRVLARRAGRRPALPADDLDVLPAGLGCLLVNTRGRPVEQHRAR